METEKKLHCAFLTNVTPLPPYKPHQLNYYYSA